jgi:hypothetical protein
MLAAHAHAVLVEKGVKHLHHANSVTTSCSFLAMKCLASRAAVEAASIGQTAQKFDARDQKLGIWNDIFTDGVDIHNRARRRNIYGPVLFQLPIDYLLNLPANSEVLVTRQNPIHWRDGQSVNDCYFDSPESLRAGYNFGDFKCHIVIRSPGGVLPFPSGPIDIILDRPNFVWQESNRTVYDVAIEKLTASAQQSGLVLNLVERVCQPGCVCGEKDQNTGYNPTIVSQMY